MYGQPVDFLFNILFPRGVSTAYASILLRTLVLIVTEISQNVYLIGRIWNYCSIFDVLSISSIKCQIPTTVLRYLRAGKSRSRFFSRLFYSIRSLHSRWTVERQHIIIRSSRTVKVSRYHPSNIREHFSMQI